MWISAVTSIGSFFAYSLVGMMPARLRCASEGHTFLKLFPDETRQCAICGCRQRPLVQTRAEAYRVLFGSGPSMR